MTDGHVHDPFRCPPHVAGCGCPDREGTLCNPYYAAGYCPDDGGEDQERSDEKEARNG